MTDSARRFLPYGRQSIDAADIAAVERVLRSDYLTTGPVIEEFEAAFAARVGARHAVSCANGTAGLHLAALALGQRLAKNAWAVEPAITFLATANAARYVGAEVQFADVDAGSGLMGADHLTAALDAAAAAGHRPTAVFPVHLNGQCCDMEAIAAVARRHGLAVVEDACHAIGGDGVGACAHAEMAVFSLHPVKTITSAEGGVVTCNDDALAERLRRLRNHGITREPADFVERDQAFDESGEAYPWYYEMIEIGYNYRLSAVHAALGLSQLRRLDDFVAHRRLLARRYDEQLAPLAPLVRPVTRIEHGDEPAWHLYVALIDFAELGIDRAGFMAALRQAGVGAQVHYPPVSRQPYYRRRYGAIELPGADTYYAHALSLPLFAGMTNDDVDRVVAALTALVDRTRSA